MTRVRGAFPLLARSESVPEQRHWAGVFTEARSRSVVPAGCPESASGPARLGSARLGSVYLTATWRQPTESGVYPIQLRPARLLATRPNWPVARHTAVL